MLQNIAKTPVRRFHWPTGRRRYNFDALPGFGGSGRGGDGSGGGGAPTGFISLAGQWPLTMTNTGICVCPQGERMVVERFGKMVDIKEPG